MSKRDADTQRNHPETHTPGEYRRNSERGQLVLLAAAALAIALAPIVLAYLQLGYHADVQASTEYDRQSENAERFLERAVHESTVNQSAEYDWQNRSDAIDAVQNRLDPRLATLASARIEAGTAYQLTYNQSAAQNWARLHCPSGPDRQFGSCETHRGVVIQKRTNQTHVLAVAVDVTVTTDRTTTEMTQVIKPTT